MTLHTLRRSFLRRLGAGLALATGLAGTALGQPVGARGDYIVAVVNQELVTNSEVQQRLNRIEQEAQRSGARLPSRDQLRQQVLDALIDERAQLSHARLVGVRVDEAEVDRAIANIAAQNQLTLAQLRERLRTQGMDYARFRANVRDELMVTRLREREVQGRIRVSDAEIEKYLEQLRAEAGSAVEYDVAQVLIAVPENATPEQEAERRARAEQVLAQARAGADFAQLVREHSDGGNRDQGGRLGLRPANRLPDLFVQAVAPLRAGEVVPQVLRSGAGFHILKLAESKDGKALAVTQTRARHILLRTSPESPQEAALQRLAEFKRQIEQGEAGFAQLARQYSEDGSAAQGGDLGWALPGQFVPEFEQVMNELPVGRLSDPFVSRFGAHLIQVVDRRQVELDARQQREMATNALREQKFEKAYLDWAREIRAQAYIEMREPPQ
ncbi:MAG TPA: peptidylprolyl isomerase [Burkholderiaceae bacterium]|nr:peptidylprolyl isomerase [Burkholderiaceae bacterium]